MASRRIILSCLLLLVILTSSSSAAAAAASYATNGVSSSQKVKLTLYYETLCPYCARFIVNELVKLYQNGLISIVDLRLVPWGNANMDFTRSFICQVSALHFFFVVLFFFRYLSAHFLWSMGAYYIKRLVGTLFEIVLIAWVQRSNKSFLNANQTTQTLALFLNWYDKLCSMVQMNVFLIQLKLVQLMLGLIW